MFVRDEQNRLLLHNWYDRGNSWLIEQEFGNGESLRYHYELAPKGFYAVRVTLTLDDGSVKTVEIGDTVSEVYKRMP